MPLTKETVDILMVDDREDGLIALEALLSDNKNYNLVKANSGIEAFGLLRHHDFAMILLDVQMPDLDGFQTAELIRNQPNFSGIPILFVTAIDKDDRYVYRGYESGAVDYIFKPFDPLILKSKVAVFADLHRKNRKISEQARLLSRKEAQEHQTKLQLLELENLKRYRNLADAIPHIVWRASQNGQMEYYNQLWCDYTGLNQIQSVGSGWQAVFHEDDLKSLLSIWMHSIQSGENFEMEARIRRFDGEFRWHWIKGVAERDQSLKVMAWMGTCTDIQHRKTTEKKLIEAQKTAEAANVAKTQFLANMSHEIRTPLNAIIGFTELMLDPHQGAPERMSSLSIVRRNSQQLLKIIDEILDISKVESGGFEVEKIETETASLVLGIRSLLNVQALRKNIRLEFLVDGKIPEIVLTDSTRLRQILLNVIGNAIKFTDHGVVRIQARFLEKSPNKSILQFSVQDTGIGLGESLAEKIFTPFLQADSSTTRLYGGTGLGLALARKFARALGGDVWLEKTELGKGSIFIVEVEAELLAQTNWVTAFRDLRGPDTISTPFVYQNHLKGAKILLAEDAKDNQILIRRFLESSGAVIDIANNGEEAIEKALSNDYEVVLMDIQMPVIDGYEATLRLRQAGYQKPIIALTAHALREEREKCLRTGCNGHLTKPLDRRRLIESLIEYMHPRH